MIQFDGNDEGYLRWIAKNPTGFVLNVRRVPSSEYIVLHRASCQNISTNNRKLGAYTERFYRKWCAESVEQLRDAARHEGRPDGSFSKYCSMCRP